MLDLQVFDDGFDHQAGIGQCIDGLDRLQASADRLARVSLQPAFFHQPLQLAIDPGDSLSRGAGTVVIEHHRVPGLGRHLGYAGAHGARADHGDPCADVECRHAQRPLNCGVRLFMKAPTPSR
ncbi:hypothetical protein D3C76_435670 [compost metagenome]